MKGGFPLEKQTSINRRAFIWNTISGMVFAMQSAIVLIFISHFLPRNDAGVFTIAYALANLFYTMGKYGVRNYQVTDVREKSRFSEYLRVRVYTVLGSLAVLAIYLAVQGIRGGYTGEKIAAIVAICLWKMVDAVEDVYYGMYQQKGRLDIGAKNYSVRLIASTVVLCALIALRMSLLAAVIVTTVFSIALAALLIHASCSAFRESHRRVRSRAVREILRVCLPLFVGTSLSIFVGNLPKYLIDWYLDESTQAIFGYIMMPAFVISMLNQFVYQPIIRSLGELWQNGERKRFISRVLKQYLVVLGITLVVMAGGALLGIPVLSLMYNVDLAPYKVEFLLLLLGGGIYALVTFVMVPITAMRFQKCIPYGFIGASVLSLVLGRFIVPARGILGAAYIYLILNLLLTAYLTGCFLYRANRAGS